MAKDKDNGIDFVRIDILENWRFWNTFAQKGDYEGAGREVVAQANAMLAQDTETNERAARLINESLEFRRKKSEAGKKGGAASAKARWGEQPAKNKEAPQPFNPYQRIKPPESRDEVFSFGTDNGIPDWCVIEWYEMCAARQWKDRKGNTIYNWKGALTNFYKSKQEDKK